VLTPPPRPPREGGYSINAYFVRRPWLGLSGLQELAPGTSSCRDDFVFTMLIVVIGHLRRLLTSSLRVGSSCRPSLAVFAHLSSLIFSPDVRERD